MEIVLIRHGEPEWVLDGLNVDNPPLTSRGHRQAAAMAEYLRGQEFDEVFWTFQSPSNVAAVDGVAKPSTANSEAAIRDFEDVVMTCPFGLDAIKVSQWLLDDRDCHHARKNPAFPRGYRLSGNRA